jgi:hypothetical protein
MRRPAFFTALLVAALASASARAQSPIQNKVAAEALYQDATTLMREKNFAAACPKLEEVVRLQPDGIGAKLTLADCYEADGRLASAWSMFAAAEVAAGKAGQAARQKKAAARMAALKPKLARVVVELDAATQALPNLEVTRDAVPVGPAQWGAPIPVDKGQHVVVANAMGKERFERAITVRDGDTITVRVEGLRDIPAPPPAPPPPKVEPPPAPLAPEPPKPPAPPPSKGPNLRTEGLAVGSVGVALLAVSGIYGVFTIVRRDQSNVGHCDGNYCDATGIELRKEGIGHASRATGFFIAGTVSVATGAALFFTSPKPPPDDAEKPQPKPSAPSVAIGPGSLFVSGTF